MTLSSQRGQTSATGFHKFDVGEVVVWGGMALKVRAYDGVLQGTRFYRLGHDDLDMEFIAREEDINPSVAGTLADLARTGKRLGKVSDAPGGE